MTGTTIVWVVCECSLKQNIHNQPLGWLISSPKILILNFGLNPVIGVTAGARILIIWDSMQAIDSKCRGHFQNTEGEIIDTVRILAFYDGLYALPWLTTLKNALYCATTLDLRQWQNLRSRSGIKIGHYEHAWIIMGLLIYRHTSLCLANRYADPSAFMSRATLPLCTTAFAPPIASHCT